MDTEASTNPDLSRTLDDGSQRPAPWRRWARWAVAALLLIVAAVFIFGRDAGTATKYMTQEVTRGDLTVTVTATGNLEPRNQVDIGSELSGTIRSVAADVNDTVKAPTSAVAGFASWAKKSSRPGSPVDQESRAGAVVA